MKIKSFFNVEIKTKCVYGVERRAGGGRLWRL